MIHIRNSVIIVLCVTIVFLGIGFIVLSMDLKKEKNQEFTFDVSFSRIMKATSIKGGNIEPTGKIDISQSGKELDMSFSVTSVHDELSYVVTIRNNGNLPAKIVDILQSPDYSIKTFQTLILPVTITISDLKGKKIDPGEEVDLRINVYYNPSNLPASQKLIYYKLGIVAESV